MDTDKMRKKYGDDFVKRWMTSRMKTRQETRKSQPVRNMRKVNTDRARIANAMQKSFHEEKLREMVWRDLREMLVESWAPPKKETAALGTAALVGAAAGVYGGLAARRKAKKMMQAHRERRMAHHLRKARILQAKMERGSGQDD